MNTSKKLSCNNLAVSQVIYNNSLFLCIIDYIDMKYLYTFMQLSRDHHKILLENCIFEFLSSLKNGNEFPHIKSKILHTSYSLPNSSSILIPSHMMSFISQREPLLPLLRNSYVKVSAQDLLQMHYDISPRILLHMDQCMYNYSLCIDAGNTDMVIAELVKIARTYIMREDIRTAQDVQSHHKYIIMKATQIRKYGLDAIMSEIFTNPTDLELVIDFANFNDVGNNIKHDTFRRKFGQYYNIKHISFIGENLKNLQGKHFLVRCKTIKSVILPNNICKIGEYFLVACTSLKFVCIPESVIKIGGDFLSGCKSLTSISIPKNVTCINRDFLYGCSSLKYIYMSDNITIGKSVTSIQSHFLKNFRCIKSVTISNTVTRIGHYVLCWCTSLTSVTISSNVTTIGDAFLSGCTSLQSVTIPDTVTSIGRYFLSGCSSLTSVTISNNVTTIGDAFLSGCTSLQSVTLPQGLTCIGNDFLYGCTSLTSITIPRTVSSFGEKFMYACTSLVSITIACDNISVVGKLFLYNCSALQTIINGPSDGSLERALINSGDEHNIALVKPVESTRNMLEKMSCIVL
jgi:hypothetical protein